MSSTTFGPRSFTVAHEVEAIVMVSHPAQLSPQGKISLRSPSSNAIMADSILKEK